MFVFGRDVLCQRPEGYSKFLGFCFLFWGCVGSFHGELIGKKLINVKIFETSLLV